jgi:hypothetical protein
MISSRWLAVALLAGAACNASGAGPGTATVVPRDAPAPSAPPVVADPGDPAPMGSAANAPDFGVEEMAPMPARCNELGAQFEKIVPSVVVLVDRSKSMFEAGGQSVRAQLWDPLEEALTNTSDGVIPQLQSEVRFGFTAYNSDFSNPAAATCPNLASVPISLDNGTSIASAYAAAGMAPAPNSTYYKWETPTAESVRAVTAELTGFAQPGPKYILLVTDGNPDRCGEPDPQCGQDDAIAAVQAAFAAGITTYVVGIGDVATATNDANSGCWGRCGALHLQDLANAGVGLPVLRNTDPAYLNNCFNGTTRRDANGRQLYLASYVDDPLAAGSAQFFAPSGRSALRDALSSILSGVRSCTFSLTQQVRTGKEATGNVLLDGAPLVYGAADGWLLENGTEVELQGAACSRLQKDVENLEIYFPCEAYIR